MANNKTIKLKINGNEVEAPSGVTVLRAAELNGIYIPTLCSHKDLSPYGGCRLCIVEIEGMRGYPLACSQFAEDGMNVLTETVQIQETRRELVQLLMSEHPSSCLICPEAVECRTFMKTVRKAGVTSGCRYCSNDGQCEFQDVVNYLEIDTIKYPVLYRGHESERYDPFFDRDYNICILCGRCIRMCQEMRGTSVLAFNHRGSRVQVGTAFERTHIEAGCEFCGACVEVCPTGSLAEKASKWDGVPDGSIITTCPYCAIGCQMEMFYKNGFFSKAIPVKDSEVNNGQACLKGRFCMGEVTHHVDRSRKPFAMINGYWKEQTWEQAIALVSDKLKDLKPEQFAMLVSPDCTNESLYTAQKFTRTVMKTNSIDSVGREDLGGGLGFWARIFQKQVSIQRIKKASKILAIGLDTRFNFSIIGVEIRKAIQNGAELISINSRESNIANYAKHWIRSKPAMEGAVLDAFVKALDGDDSEYKKIKKELEDKGKSFDEALETLKNFKDLTVIFGPRIFKYSDTSSLTSALLELLEKTNVSVIPLYYGTNTRGAVDLGVFPEMLPGAAFKGDKKEEKLLEDVWKTKLPSDDGYSLDQIISGKAKPKILYLVGAVPFLERPKCDFLIVQDIFEPDFKVDLFLPAASFIESSGTLVNMEGRVQEAAQVEKLPDSVQFGRARPDWWILSEIAKKMGAKGFDYKSDGDILNEISKVAYGFPESGKITRGTDTFRISDNIPDPTPAPKKAPKADKLQLIVQPSGYTYRGIDIRPKVEGLQILEPEIGFYMNSDDAKALGIVKGDRVKVKADGASGVACVNVKPEIPKGAVYMYVPQGFGGMPDLKEVSDLFNLKHNPCPVEVEKVGV